MLSAGVALQAGSPLPPMLQVEHTAIVACALINQRQKELKLPTPHSPSPLTQQLPHVAWSFMTLSAGVPLQLTCLGRWRLVMPGGGDATPRLEDCRERRSGGGVWREGGRRVVGIGAWTPRGAWQGVMRCAVMCKTGATACPCSSLPKHDQHKDASYWDCNM